MGMVAVPVSLPFPEAGKAAGFHGSSRVGVLEAEGSDGCGG